MFHFRTAVTKKAVFVSRLPCKWVNMNNFGWSCDKKCRICVTAVHAHDAIIGSCPRRHRRNQQREIRTKRPGHLSCHIASPNHLQRSLNVQPAALGSAVIRRCSACRGSGRRKLRKDAREECRERMPGRRWCVLA